MPGADRSTLLARLESAICRVETRLGLTEPADLPPLPGTRGDRQGPAHHRALGGSPLGPAGGGGHLHGSRTAERLFGWTSSELVGRSAYELLHPDDVDRIAADRAAHASGPGEAHRVRYPLRAADGPYRRGERRTRATHGRGHIVCITADTETEVVALRRMRGAERRLRAELEQQASSDAVSTMPSRRALELELEEELSRARRQKTALPGVLPDVDGFKQVSDQRDHAAGARLLAEVGAILPGTRRSSGRVGR